MRHIIKYNTRLGLSRGDFRQCEITGRRGVDLHHIFGRVQNEHLTNRGVTDPDEVRNVMALCREAHDYFHEFPEFNDWLWDVHQEYLEDRDYLYSKNSRDPNLLKFLLIYRNKFRKLGSKTEGLLFEEE